MEVYRRYRDWVRRNGNVLALAETGLSTLTWLLPDRFADNELSLEAVHTAINLISAVHDTMLNDPGAGAPRGAAELTLALNSLQQVQVLVELWGLYSERTGTIDSRYDPLVAVEGLKSIVRLAILRTSGCRILVNGGTTTFDPVFGSSNRGPGSENRAKEVFAAFAAFRDTHCLPPPVQMSQVENNSSSSSSSSGVAKPPPQGSGRETTTNTSSGADAILGEVKDGLTQNDKDKDTPRLWWEEREKESCTITSEIGSSGGANLSSKELTFTGGAPSANAQRELEQRAARRQAAAYRLIILGELMHILRPLLYVAALRRWGRRSWKPWVISLGIELTSGRLTAAGVAASQRAAAAAAADPAVAGTALAALYGMQGMRWRRDEAEELTRRKLLLLYSLLRDPFFSRVTGPAVERWQQRLGRVPLVGRVADKAAEVLLGVQKYYSYTAAS